MILCELAKGKPDAALLLRDMLGLIISAHHNQLPDAVDLNGGNLFSDRINKRDAQKDLHMDEVQKFIKENDTGKNLEKLFDSATDKLDGVINSLISIYRQDQNKQTGNQILFAYGFFVKYLYSCLVDADRLNARNFDLYFAYEHKSIDWQPIIDKFENKLKELNNGSNSPIDKIRADISRQCKEKAESPSGLYRLNVPTGGGKTLSSMRFALYHANKYGKSRIIYVIPYL